MAMNRSAASAIGSVATLMWAFSGLAWAVTEVFDEFDDLDEVEPPEELQATAARMVAAATAPSRRRGGRANVTDASWPPGGQVRIGNPGQAIQRGEFLVAWPGLLDSVSTSDSVESGGCQNIAA